MTKKNTLPSFAGYKPLPVVPTPVPQYFDPASKKLTPLSEVKFEYDEEHHEVYEVLDSLTLALEAGVVSEKAWLKDIFGTPAAFEGFLEYFENYDESFRINDRWNSALALLGDTIHNEEGFITCQDIADRLREVARETGQL